MCQALGQRSFRAIIKLNVKKNGRIAFSIPLLITIYYDGLFFIFFFPFIIYFGHY